MIQFMEDAVQPTALQRHVLATLRVLLRPIVRLSIAHGVKFQQLSELLKIVSLDVAQVDLRAEGRRVNASLLSVVTGLHRKDVNRLSRRRDGPEPPAEPSIESQVFTRWISDPAYLEPGGRPRALPRTSIPGTPAASFESLARSVTSDVHPRAILDSLLRLGMAAVDERDRVTLLVERFVPSNELARMLNFVRDSNHDHLAAAVANVMGQRPPFLEQSLFAEGLSAEAAERLNTLARQEWTRLVRQIAPEVERLEARTAQAGVRAPDAAMRAHLRVRLGMYFYAEPSMRVAEPPADDVASARSD